MYIYIYIYIYWDSLIVMAYVTVVTLNCRFGGRLASIKENNKFRGTTGDDQKETSGLKDFVLDIKKNFCLK